MPKQVSAREIASIDVKVDDGAASAVQDLTQLMKASLQADKRLHCTTTALESKVSELAGKVAEAKRMRAIRCAE